MMYPQLCMNLMITWDFSKHNSTLQIHPSLNKLTSKSGFSSQYRIKLKFKRYFLHLTSCKTYFIYTALDLFEHPLASHYTLSHSHICFIINTTSLPWSFDMSIHFWVLCVRKLLDLFCKFFFPATSSMYRWIFCLNYYYFIITDGLLMRFSLLAFLSQTLCRRPYFTHDP